MLGVSRPEGVELQLEFGSEPSAIASFDIYGGEAGLGLSATLELARQIEGPPLVTLPLALSRAGEGRVVATATVPLGALAPGDYILRGVIRLQDGSAGSVTRTLRKTAPSSSSSSSSAASMSKPLHPAAKLPRGIPPSSKMTRRAPRGAEP